MLEEMQKSPEHRRQETLASQLLRSKKFLQWGTPAKPKPKTSFGRSEGFSYVGEKYTNLMADERHYTPAELAELWGVSSETIRQIFRNEPGVLRVGSNGSTKTRKYILQRIPESVAQRVHKRMSAVPAVAE